MRSGTTREFNSKAKQQACTNRSVCTHTHTHKAPALTILHTWDIINVKYYRRTAIKTTTERFSLESKCNSYALMTFYQAGVTRLTSRALWHRMRIKSRRNVSVLEECCSGMWHQCTNPRRASWMNSSKDRGVKFVCLLQLEREATATHQ